ncbi:Oxoglutarate/iron-dependent oxygenase [Venturia nashicola]|uniref:Oxoglutarate/iron-dependent oxygenase n=1 Tax=Venturia nashicola TaxID=86259 RepID=A0A4Z1P4G9_9PEZI|nr:Oxoglutarate/iron-dependent oxygenase [Venturia nashicola]
MVSSQELQRLTGFLEGSSNFDDDTQSALQMSRAGPRKSSRSKPPILKAPELGTSAREAPARKRKVPKRPRRRLTATASKSQSSVERIVSSISTLSDPPSYLNLDGDEVPIPPPAKRQKRNSPKVTKPASSRLSRVLTLKFMDAENRQKFNDLANALESQLHDTDHPTSDVNDGTESTDTEIDDIEDESDYASTAAKRSSKRAQKIPSRRTTVVKRTQASNSTLPRPSRVQKGAKPRTPFLNRSLKLGIFAPPAKPNGIFAIEPLPFYEDRTAASVANTSVLKGTRTTGRRPPSLTGLRQSRRASSRNLALPSPPQPSTNLRQLAIDTHQKPVSPLRQHSTVLQHPAISRQQLQLRAGLDPITGRDYERKSNALMRMTKRKPKPQGKPPVWAVSRQILCETVPYYRSHHGAGYANKGVAYSFMFNAQASDRDYMDSTVVVSRAGGGMEKDEETGAMIQTKDTAKSHIVRAFMNGVKFQQPVCIITGSKNPTAQFEIPHEFCVLDWFKPTHVWTEKVGDRRVIRYRFEVLDSGKAAWWRGEGVVEAVELAELPPPFSHQCPSCQQESQQIYLNGWMCTNYDCLVLWQFIDGTDPDNSTLVYDPRWLKQTTPWSHASPPQATKPDPWILAKGSRQFDHGMVWQATKGIACPNCDMCGPREHWTYWECRNCHTRYETPRSIVTPDLLHDWLNPVDTGYAHTKDDFHESVKLTLLFIGNYRVHIYTIPGIDGFVAHMLANKTVNEERDGPDDMFVQLQKEDIGLKRASMRPGSGEEALTNQFAKNFGMPYKYVASPESSSMEDAPKAIRDSRSRLNWACRTILAKQGRTFDNEFNEVLALAYMEGNKINYHDDGEFGLGPTIATLSLGYPATMNIRMKQRHYRGCTTLFTDRPPLPGSLKYEERLAAYNDLQDIEKPSHAYRRRLHDLPSELGLMDKTRIDPATGKSTRIKSEQDPVISMKLCHGGIVIMHGTGIQECFEHAVTPEGKMRIALTSRYIDPDSLKGDEKPTWAVENEKEPYDGLKLPAPKW